MATIASNSQSSAPEAAPPTTQNEPQSEPQKSSIVDDEHQPQSQLQSQSQLEPQPLSKKAQKKLRKAEFLAERKLERRAREKEKRKEKKRERAERIAAGEDIDPEDDGGSRAKKRAKLSHGAARKAFGARVVVDLGFDDKMSEKVRCFSFCLFPLRIAPHSISISIRGASLSRRVSRYLHACICLSGM